MPTITVRLSDSIRDGLQAKASEASQSLSDFVRDRLEDAVFAYKDDGGRDKGLEPASLSVMDRRTLSLLNRYSYTPAFPLTQKNRSLQDSPTAEPEQQHAQTASKTSRTEPHKPTS